MFFAIFLFCFFGLAIFLFIKKQSLHKPPEQDVDATSKVLGQSTQDLNGVVREKLPLESKKDLSSKGSYSEKSTKEQLQPIQRSAGKQINFEQIQNPILKRLGAPSDEVNNETSQIQNDLNFEMKQNEEYQFYKYDRAISKEQEDHLKELEKKFSKDLEPNFEDKDVFLPSLQKVKKTPEERIEAISPVLKSATIDDEEEGNKPIFEELESREREESIIEKKEVIFEGNQKREAIGFRDASQARLPTFHNLTKHETKEGKKEPNWEEDHFMPNEYQEKKQYQNNFLLDQPHKEEFRQEGHFIPEDFQFRVQKSEPLVVISESPSEFLLSQRSSGHPLTLQDNSVQVIAKNTIKRNFNFRSNKNKIESILKDDNLIIKDHIQSDISLDKDNSTLSAPESAVDAYQPIVEEKPNEKENFDEKDLLKTLEKKNLQMKPRGFNFKNRSVNNILEDSFNKSNRSTQQEKVNDREIVLQEDKILKTTEMCQGKPKGFNFKNPRMKAINEFNSNINISELKFPPVMQSENIEPVSAEDKQIDSCNQVDMSKLETKKMKGFNFRNSNKLKNQ